MLGKRYTARFNVTTSAVPINNSWASTPYRSPACNKSSVATFFLLVWSISHWCNQLLGPLRWKVLWLHGTVQNLPPSNQHLFQAFGAAKVCPGWLYLWFSSIIYANHNHFEIGGQSSDQQILVRYRFSMFFQFASICSPHDGVMQHCNEKYRCRSTTYQCHGCLWFLNCPILVFDELYHKVDKCFNASGDTYLYSRPKMWF